jgi:hypothetical protein
LKGGNKNEISLKNGKRLEYEADQTSSDRLPVLMGGADPMGQLAALLLSCHGIALLPADKRLRALTAPAVYAVISLARR